MNKQVIRTPMQFGRPIDGAEEEHRIEINKQSNLNVYTQFGRIFIRQRRTNKSPDKRSENNGDGKTVDERGSIEQQKWKYHLRGDLTLFASFMHRYFIVFFPIYNVRISWAAETTKMKTSGWKMVESRKKDPLGQESGIY